MSKKHLENIIKKLKAQLEDLYTEAYNDGLQDGRDEIIVKYSLQNVVKSQSSNKSSECISNKKKIIQILSELPNSININYNGGNNPGWKMNCNITNCSKTSAKVIVNGEFKTFLYKKIEEVKYSNDYINKAINNYVDFHNVDRNNVNIDDIKNSSAGINGWAKDTKDYESDIIQKFKDIKFNPGTNSNEKSKKRRTKH